MERMNKHIVEANIILQDEIRTIKIDNKMLQKRMQNAAEFLKEIKNKFKVFDLEEEIEQAIDILEGNYYYEGAKKIKF